MGLELKRRRSGWKRTQHCRQLHRSTDSGYGYVYTRGKSVLCLCVWGVCVFMFMSWEGSCGCLQANAFL